MNMAKLRDAAKPRYGTPREALAESFLELDRALRRIRSLHTTALADPAIDARVSDVHAELRAIAEELAPGVELEVDWQTCSRCNGIGRDHFAAGDEFADVRTCQRCHGRGIVEDAS